MAKQYFRYPKFLINRDNNGKHFIAVINPNLALLIIRAGNYSRSGGFEFNTYISRAKVLEYERMCGGSDTTAQEFFKQANEFMSSRLMDVLSEVVKADPMLLGGQATKLLK